MCSKCKVFIVSDFIIILVSLLLWLDDLQIGFQDAVFLPSQASSYITFLKYNNNNVIWFMAH